LIELGRYDIVGLSEVAKSDVYETAIDEQWPQQFGFVRGTTGRSDKLLIMFNCEKFDRVASADMDEAGGVKFNNGRHRAPLYVRLKDRSNGQELIVIQNHLVGPSDTRRSGAGPDRGPFRR
jgi:hypothetical protein